jgi:hypothetical protein
LRTAIEQSTQDDVNCLIEADNAIWDNLRPATDPAPEPGTKHHKRSVNKQQESTEASSERCPTFLVRKYSLFMLPTQKSLNLRSY